MSLPKLVGRGLCCRAFKYYNVMCCVMLLILYCILAALIIFNVPKVVSPAGNAAQRRSFE